MSDDEVKITPTIYPKRGNRRNGKMNPSQKDRKVVYKRELKRLNIHRPLGEPTREDVKTMQQLKEMLKETWQNWWKDVEKFQRFTIKQMRFAQQYARNGRTNVVGSMRQAGYESSNPVVLLAMGKKNLKLGHFETMIKAFELEEKVKMKMNVEDVVNYFSKIADTSMENGDFTNANRAMENLAKYLGMFVERKEITHRVVHSKEELDARIIELKAILKDAEPEIQQQLRIA